MKTTNYHLQHHFLIATPNIDTGIFHQSLVYICHQDKQGALGLIINKPLSTSLVKLFDELQLPVTSHSLLQHRTPLNAGPLNSAVGFILHTGQPNWSSSFAVAENVCVTTSKDILQSIGSGQGVEYFELCLGHSSWIRGQLENEIERGDWFVIPAQLDLLFKVDYSERWQQAMNILGVNLDKFSMDIGHA